MQTPPFLAVGATTASFSFVATSRHSQDLNSLSHRTNVQVAQQSITEIGYFVRSGLKSGVNQYMKNVNSRFINYIYE
jgi:hypothetical protein